MSSSMFMVGVTLKLYDQMSGGMLKNVEGMDKLIARTEKLRASSVGLMADGLMAGGAMLAPIKAFAELDDAMSTLEVAMMQKGGKVGEAFAPLKKQIVELGNKLPGTTADYANLATTMISLGVPAEKLVGGALNAAANLKVVLKMTSEAAGETVVKMREAYNLNDSELAKTADIAQRAKFAFGLKPEDLRVAASYQSAQLNILHLQGAENMQKMLTMQGVANLKGLDGSSFGTNMSMMLTRLATGPQMLEMAHKGMKGVGKNILDDLHIKFNFFDKKGNFAGLDNMVSEFKKFHAIHDKYGDKGVSEVSNALFGIEAARPAMILAEYGDVGYENAKKRFESQASLQERIDRYLKTAENIWKAFTGTLTNLMAAFGQPIVEFLEPYIQMLNDITGGPLQAFVEKHKTLVLLLGGAVLLFATLAIGLGVMGLIFAGVTKYIILVTSALGVLRAAIFGIQMFLMANPIYLALTLLATAALLIYENWTPIKEFFIGLWGGIKDAFNSTVDWIVGKFMAFVDWFGEKAKVLADMMPDWMKKYTLPGMAVNFAANTFAPDKPSAANANKVQVHNQMDVRVYDARPPQVSIKPSGFGHSFNAHAGQTMVTP